MTSANHHEAFHQSFSNSINGFTIAWVARTDWESYLFFDRFDCFITCLLCEYACHTYNRIIFISLVITIDGRIIPGPSFNQLRNPSAKPLFINITRITNYAYFRIGIKINSFIDSANNSVSNRFSLCRKLLYQSLMVGME